MKSLFTKEYIFKRFINNTTLQPNLDFGENEEFGCELQEVLPQHSETFCNSESIIY